MSSFSVTMPTDQLELLFQEAMTNDDEELQFACERELNARERDREDPAYVADREHREDYGY